MPPRTSRTRKAGRSKGRRAPTIPALKRKAWGLLSRCIRLEAQAKAQAAGQGFVPCYTCEQLHEWNDGLQAGHAIPGRTGSTLLDEEIIRPQCPRCNIWGRGMYHVFTSKLIREKAENEFTGHPYAIEQAFSWWQLKVSESRQVKKWNRAELEEKIASYKARLANLA